jgi:hypothetical protein
MRSLGIRDQPISPRSPWQIGCAERLIGSIRRECLDHFVVIGERHLRHVLLSSMEYYNGARTHLSLCKDTPIARAVQRSDGSAHNQSSAGFTIKPGFDLRQGHGREPPGTLIGFWDEADHERQFGKPFNP